MIKNLYDYTINKNIHEFVANNPDFVFYSMRVDDPRYKYDEIYKTCAESGRTLVVSNYNNAQLPEDPAGIVVDLSKFFEEKDYKYVYYLTLSLLSNRHTIYRLETDMHVGFIEQLHTHATVIHPNFDDKDIEDYIFEPHEL